MNFFLIEHKYIRKGTHSSNIRRTINLLMIVFFFIRNIKDCNRQFISKLRRKRTTSVRLHYLRMYTNILLIWSTTFFSYKIIHVLSCEHSCFDCIRQRHDRKQLFYKLNHKYTQLQTKTPNSLIITQYTH